MPTTRLGTLLTRNCAWIVLIHAEMSVVNFGDEIRNSFDDYFDFSCCASRQYVCRSRSMELSVTPSTTTAFIQYWKKLRALSRPREGRAEKREHQNQSFSIRKHQIATSGFVCDRRFIFKIGHFNPRLVKTNKIVGKVYNFLRECFLQ